MAAKISIILQTSKHSAVFLVIFSIQYTVIQLYSFILGVSCPLFMILLIYIFIYILIIKYFQKNGGSKNKLYIV